MKIQKLIDKKLIFGCLDEIIKPEDSVIIFYVGIWPFIHQLNLKDKNVCRGFLRILENYIGNKRTMLFPSFTSKEFLYLLNMGDVIKTNNRTIISAGEQQADLLFKLL